MDSFTTVLEQTRQLAIQHAPADLLRETVPVAIVCLIAGIGISVLGAKLSRIGLTGAWVLVGAMGGAWVSRESGFPMPICVAAGALMVGIIGYQTFRVWVGIGSALVISSVVLGAFGYQRVVPHVSEFEREVGSPTVQVSDAFVIPTPEQQRAYVDRAPREWFQRFWSFVLQRDGTVERNGRALALASLVTGLCIGLIAVRAALILSTSLLGTMLFSTGIGTLLTHIAHDQTYQALRHHPNVIGLAIGAFLLGSIVLQTLLTRPNPKPKEDAKAATA